MKRSTIVIISALMTLALSLPARAQNETSGAGQPGTGGAELGRVVQGNTTIVFNAADASDLDVDRLRTWGEFAEAHPKIAKVLAYNPSLMSDSSYLAKHPELDTFFLAHPEIKDAMAENPGNFVAIPPRPGE